MALVDEAERAIEAEWAEDSQGQGYVTAERLGASWFQLADLHTDGVSVSACAGCPHI